MSGETSPLLPQPDGPSVELSKGRFSPYRRVLLASLFLSISFVFTATPLLFSYRTFTCDEYYNDHPPYTGSGDRCDLPEIATRTAKSISIMIALTTIAGVLNLFVTTWEIRHWGVRSALNQQTFWPCLRNLCQIFAMYRGGADGILIVQVTQLITIAGGGAGYMLAANNYIAELVPAEQRTGAFGVLQGVAMAGTSIGFTLGGLTGDAFGTPAPFQVTFCLLVLSTLFTRFCLPYIPPAASLPPPSTDGTEDDNATIKPSAAHESAFSFLHCLKVFQPQPLDDGRGGKFWGLTLLGAGCFTAVLATSYVPLMLQLTATNSYGYHPTENGYLMSLSSFSRALFLALAFPRIIAYGRKRASARSKRSSSSFASGSTSAASSRPRSPVKDAIPTDARDFESSHAIFGAEEGMEEPANVEAVMPPTDAKHGSAFDLTFLRWSMVVDALLTALVGFSSQGWHMMLAAGILPLASGTAPAAKGCMMEMVSPSKKGDALSAIALVETFAMISTVSIFGSVFAYLSELGRPNDVFFLNAGMALLAAGVLLFVRFPRTVVASPGSV